MIDSVKVRMYRQGFGDCFLLRFFSGEQQVTSVLIDCGLKHASPAGPVNLKKVVQNIASLLPEEEGKPHLDILVITHEHWDHVSAFDPGKKLFDNFSIGDIWMAWTESPDDEEAVQIREYQHKATRALHRSRDRIRAAADTKAAMYAELYGGNNLAKLIAGFSEVLSGVVDFAGPFSAREEEQETESGIKFKKWEISVGTEEAIKHVQGFTRKGAGISYFYPGKLMEDKRRFPGVRIYVLGPPKNALLNKDRPSSGQDKETYFGDTTSLSGFVDGILFMEDLAGTSSDEGKPFSNAREFSREEIQSLGIFDQFYFNPAENWRTIDEDFLDIAGALALQMDNDTNNTSLVLAIELIDSGKVLLFPGDAQVGSWLSWFDHEFTVKEGGEKKTVTAADLLERTVLYKAGHHLSHNATLKEKGLELMQSDELVAFIPEKDGQYSGIPHPELVDRIAQRTRGRFLFSDDKNFPVNKDFENKKPRGISVADWKAFTENLEVHAHYIEYTVRG
jgi:beta-lactamase superfamily II metal-dependent hydrolase